MSSNNKKSSHFSWQVTSAFFVIFVVAALCAILWNPLIGCISIIMLMLIIYVGSILKAYSEHNSVKIHHEQVELNQEITDEVNRASSSPSYIPQDAKKLDDKELEGSQKLLRYATAILAFLSFLTTAEGMQSFVFNEGWMSYLGSFAVQGILVVFSLLLCRFYVHVAQLDWPKYIRKIVNGLLVIFFCLALIVSSTFSFSFIANNAYEGNWLSDSEMIIQTHLMDSAYDLRRENEHRGNLILGGINETADDKLSKAIESINTLKNVELTSELEDYLQVTSESNYTEANLIIDWQVVRDSYPEYLEDINVMADSYDNRTYLPGYQRNVDTYKAILNDIKSWDVDVSSLAVTTHIATISNSISHLESLQTDIEDWRTHSFNNDIAYYRTDFQNACTNLIDHLENLKANLEQILSLTEQLASIEQNNIGAELNSILSDIYLLGVDDEVSATDISGKLTDLALQASADENFTSQNIASIMELRDLLVSYSDYKELEAEITEFINSNLQNNYQVIRDTDKDKGENPTDTTLPPANDPTEPVDAIDESEWRTTRSNDFNEFYKLVKSLPIVDDNQTSYDETEVILDASQIHRDLLGEATEFEKAFNFFKYRFPFMAFFSAFIAVFFDLGSFLTGCFLYVTEFFVTTKKDKQQPEEDKLNQNAGGLPNPPSE